MATCSPDLVITKEVDNHFTFTVKADSSTLPMELVSSDTFTAKLINLESGIVELEKQLTKDSNLLSGKVHMLITEAEADGLVSEKGGKVDRWYLKPTYKLVIECDTQNNGEFTAKVNEVYVD